MNTNAVSYHDYIALIAQLDESDGFRVSSNGPPHLFRDVQERFVRACQRYSFALKENVRSYSTAIEVPLDIASHLYNPISYMAFGRADFAAIMLVDDFEPVLAIPLDVRSPVESMSVGFCPTTTSLGLAPAESQWVTTIPDLIARQSNSAHGSQSGSHMSGTATHDFQSTLPLMAMTSFKTNGTAILGEGLAFTLAIYRAVARCAARTLEELRERAQRGTESIATLMSLSDIDNFRYAIIEPQGADDLLLFMPCTNYSVAVAVVNAVRALTLADLYWSVPPLLEQVLGHRAHSGLFRLCEQAGWEVDEQEILAQWHRSGALYSRTAVDTDTASVHDTPDTWSNVAPRQLAAAFCGNHVFSRTLTTLGASFAAFDAPDRVPINGLLEPTLNVDVSCGHNTMALRQLDSALRSFVNPNAAAPISISLGLYMSAEHFVIGLHDIVYVPPLEAIADAKWDSYFELQKAHRAYAMPTAQYLSAINHIVSSFASSEHGSGDSPTAVFETGLLDLSSTISVPFPRSVTRGSANTPSATAQGKARRVRPRDLEDIDWRAHAPLLHGLRELRRRVCPEFDDEGAPSHQEVERATRSDFGVRFDLELLRTEMRRLDLPVSLRRTIQYLYYDFVASLADTHAFHAVVDLYDVFATLFVVLTRRLPDAQRHFEDAASRRLILDRNALDAICDVVRAIQSAVGHRIATTRFHDDIRSADVVFRGGVNRIMSVIDVPLKCGIEIIRMYYEGTQTRVNCLDIGAVAVLAMRMQTLCKFVSFGGERGDTGAFPCIAQVEIGVSRIFAVHQYTNLFHEALHFVRNVIDVDEGTENHVKKSLGDSDSHDKDWRLSRSRAEELFVHLCMNLLVFRGNWRLFARYTFMELSNQPDIREAEVMRLADTFLEVAAQTFLATDAIRRSHEEFGDDFLKWPGVSPYGNFDRVLLEQEGKDARDRFILFLKDFGRYFAYWEFISAKSEIWDRAEAMFELFWSATVPDVIEVEYPSAYEVVRRALRHESKESLDELDERCQESLDRRIPAYVSDGECRAGSESRFVARICGILRAYLRCQYTEAAAGSRIALWRNFEGEDFTGKPGFPDSGEAIHEFLVDPATERLRCSHPERRLDMCGRSITVIKVLWNVSTELRGQRVGILVDSTLG